MTNHKATRNAINALDYKLKNTSDPAKRAALKEEIRAAELQLTMHAFRITNESGITGAAWDAVYTHTADAAEAIRVAMGWPSVYLDGAILDGAEDKPFWYAYPTIDEARADIIKLAAPRVLEL